MGGTHSIPNPAHRREANAMSYQTTKVHMVQAATNSTSAIKAIPCGCLAWCIITWRFFFRSCGAVGVDTGFT